MDLMAEAADRLGALWRCPRPTVHAVLVDEPERAVFQTCSPDGAPVFVKVDTAADRHCGESRVLVAAAQAGIPVPVVLLADPAPPALLVLAPLAGAPLPVDAPAGAWADAGRQLRRLHDLTPPAGTPRFGGGTRALLPARSTWQDFLVTWADREAGLAVGRGLVPARAAAWVARQVRAAVAATVEPPCRLLHGDCQPDHVLVDGETVTGFLDFGDAGTGDPAWDLAVLTLDSPDRLPDVLHGYRPGGTLPDALPTMIPTYHALRHLTAANWLSTRDRDSSRQITALLRRIDADGEILEGMT